MRMRTFTISAMMLTAALNCGEAPRTGDDQFLAYPHRTCTSGGKPLKSGGKIKGGDLAAGAGSFCDGQFKHGGGRVAFRVFPNSRITYERHDGHLYLRLQKGRMLIDAEKKRAGKNIYLHSSGSMVRMLGTKVFMTRQNNTNLNVELLEGKVEVRSAPYLHLKSFHRGLSDQAERSAAKAMPELFKSKVVTLEPGTSAKIAAGNHPLAQDGALRAKLNQAFSAAEVRTAAKQDHAAFARHVEQRGKEVMTNTSEKSESMKNADMTMKKGPISDKRRWLHSRWSRNLKHIPAGAMSAGRLKVLLKRRYGDKKSDSILKDLHKKAPPGVLYKIRLKNGRTYQGRAEQVGTRYRLVTRKGDIMIKREQVERIEVLVPGK